MKLLWVCILGLAVSSIGKAATFAGSIGAERWQLSGNMLSTKANGFYVEGDVGFDKASEQAALSASFAMKLSSTTAGPNDSSEVFKADGDVHLNLLQIGPEICGNVLNGLSICGSIGLLSGELNQTQWVANTFNATYGRLGLEANIYEGIYFSLAAETFNVSERQMGRKYALQATGLSAGLGSKF